MYATRRVNDVVHFAVAQLILASILQHGLFCIRSGDMLFSSLSSGSHIGNYYHLEWHSSPDITGTRSSCRTSIISEYGCCKSTYTETLNRKFIQHRTKES